MILIQDSLMLKYMKKRSEQEQQQIIMEKTNLSLG